MIFLFNCPQCNVIPLCLFLSIYLSIQCSDGGGTQDSSLKRVAVVEDFFDIIYAMHVEMGADPGRAPKHAGQKKTYKAVRHSTWVYYIITFSFMHL